MSALSATQIPKPADEQAFERASVILWRHLLGDPNVQRNGRRGQRQDGVDIFGARGGDPERFIGIQCKLKGHGQVLTSDEFQAEVFKALGFKPALREFFIVTTAPDDALLQRLARELTLEQQQAGRGISIHVWGWDTLQERIAEHSEAHKAFDPSFGPFGERLMENANASLSLQTEVARTLEVRFGGIERSTTRLETMLCNSPVDDTIGAAVLETHLDADIDALRDLGAQGKPRTALLLLERLLARVVGTASSRILFRIKANLGFAKFALGEDGDAVRLLAEAYREAPQEPRAIANMAFSMLLSGEKGRLREFATHELAKDNTNEQLAGFLVQATRNDDQIHDPLGLVPRSLHGCAAVVIAHVDFLRSRRDEPKWWHAARDAKIRFPDDPYAKQFAAEATIDEALRSADFRRSGLLAADDAIAIREAVEVLIERWNGIFKGESVVRTEHVGLCCNILAALHGLGENTRAARLATEGLAVAPEDGELATRAVLVGLDASDNALVDAALPHLTDGLDANLLRFRLHGQRGEWAKLVALDGLPVPAVERAMMATAIELAHIRLSANAGDCDALSVLVAEASGDPRASVLAAEEAAAYGHDDLASIAYSHALGSLAQDAHQASRTMVARLAATRGDWRTVVDLLEGRVDATRDHATLRLLAAGYVNDTPIRRRALSFFSMLEPGIARLPRYLQAAGLMHFNRGALGQAEAALREAIATAPDLTSLLALASTLRRRGRGDAVATALEGIDPLKPDGTPAQRICLCQELLDVGRGVEAFDAAYKTVTAAPNDPEAALRYVGLALRDPAGRHIRAMPKVAPNAWLRLVAGSGETFEAVIEKGPDRPADGVISPRHSLAAGAMGLGVGDTFERASPLGVVSWKIDAIKHKHLHALHVVMETFQVRFPDVPGLYRVDAREGLHAVAEHARMASEAARTVADLHLVHNFPLAMAAARADRDVIGLAGYIASINADVRTCLGNEPERLAAQRAVIAARGSGAVLDAFTAWTAATMGVLDALRGLFGELIVPRSAVDELRIMADRLDVRSAGMRMGWSDEGLTGHKYTREDAEAGHRRIDDVIGMIKAACRVAPGVAPDSPSELETTLTEAFGPQILDPAHVAKEGGHLLLSDDLHFRQIAAEAVGTSEGAWIQVALATAVGAGILDVESYASAMVGLARKRHGHLPLDRATLLWAYAGDDGDLGGFAALTCFIGNPNADMRSHVAVVDEVLQILWRNGDADLKAMRATSLLVDCLVSSRGDGRGHVLAFLRWRKSGALRRHLDAWAVGHFIPAKEVDEAEAEIERFVSLSSRRNHRTRRV